MASTMKSYRMSGWALKNLQDLQDRNPNLNQTEIIEHALALAVQITEAWTGTTNALAYGPFQLDDCRQANALNRIIWDI